MSTAYEHEIAPRVGLEHYTRVATPSIRFVAWLAPELGKGPRAEFSVWVPTTQTFEYFVVHATIKDSATKKDRTDLLHSINSARYSSRSQKTRSPAYTTSQVSPAATEYWLRHQEKEARARSMLTPAVRLNIERAWALQRALAGQPQSQPLPPQGQISSESTCVTGACATVLVLLPPDLRFAWFGLSSCGMTMYAPAGNRRCLKRREQC